MAGRGPTESKAHRAFRWRGSLPAAHASKLRCLGNCISDRPAPHGLFMSTATRPHHPLLRPESTSPFHVQGLEPPSLLHLNSYSQLLQRTHPPWLSTCCCHLVQRGKQAWGGEPLPELGLGWFLNTSYLPVDW